MTEEEEEEEEMSDIHLITVSHSSPKHVIPSM
jgi:hypothetical protein